MGFEHNDIAIMGGLRAALEEESPMFERNDIVTTYKMNEAIAEGGGGGGGDFSIATVTFINSASGKAYTVFPIWPAIGENGLEYSTAVDPIDVSSSYGFEIPMYNGKAEILLFPLVDHVDWDVMPTTTGGVSFDNPNATITGDGTITFVGTRAVE